MDYLPLMIGSAIVLFVGAQMLPLLRARRMHGQLAPDLSHFLTDEQRRQRRLLVYFWSPRCGACRTMTPIVDALAKSRIDVVKINVFEASGEARACGVMGTPTLVLIRDGRIAHVEVGARSEKQIRSLLGEAT
jgi:thioredoxin 1